MVGVRRRSNDAEQVAEPRVAVAVRMSREIFLVQDGDADARPLELLDQVGPIRLRPAARADPGARPGEQLLLQGRVGQILRQRPGQPGRLGPLDGVPHGRARRAHNPADLAIAGLARVEPQHLPHLSHGHLSVCRHRVPLWWRGRNAPIG